MQGVKAVANDRHGQPTTHQYIMKMPAKIALLAAFLFTTAAAQAEWVRGYTRSNGTYVQPHYRSSSGSFGGSYRSGSSSPYKYQNPYAASPSVSVRDHYRTDGTYVLPHVRTAPNGTITDNLSYRGYGTIRVPRF